MSNRNNFLDELSSKKTEYNPIEEIVEINKNMNSVLKDYIISRAFIKALEQNIFFLEIGINNFNSSMISRVLNFIWDSEDHLMTIKSYRDRALENRHVILESVLSDFLLDMVNLQIKIERKLIENLIKSIPQCDYEHIEKLENWDFKDIDDFWYFFNSEDDEKINKIITQNNILTLIKIMIKVPRVGKVKPLIPQNATEDIKRIAIKNFNDLIYFYGILFGTYGDGEDNNSQFFLPIILDDDSISLKNISRLYVFMCEHFRNEGVSTFYFPVFRHLEYKLSKIIKEELGYDLELPMIKDISDSDMDILSELLDKSLKNREEDYIFLKIKEPHKTGEYSPLHQYIKYLNKKYKGIVIRAEDLY